MRNFYSGFVTVAIIIISVFLGAVVAHFPQIPNFLLTFKDVNGNLIPNTTMTAAWVSLDEVDNSTGSAVSGNNRTKKQRKHDRE